MTAIGAFAFVAIFLGAIWLFRIVPVAFQAINTAKQAVGRMRDDALDDDAREAAVKTASIRLLGAFGTIFLRSAAALVSAGLPIWTAEQAGFMDSYLVIRFLSRWDVILGTSAAICAGYFAVVRLWSRD